MADASDEFFFENEENFDDILTSGDKRSSPTLCSEDLQNNSVSSNQQNKNTSYSSTDNLSSSPPKPKKKVESMSKSEKIGSLQNIFTDSQKIAYVGLCYLCIRIYKKNRLEKFKNAQKSFENWSSRFMEKLYIYIDLSTEERSMIQQLAEHGLLPSDLSKSLLQDAKESAAKMNNDISKNLEEKKNEALDNGKDSTKINEEDIVKDMKIEENDVRYTILGHLFILCISDGTYDSRERALLKTVAEHLCVPSLDVILLEKTIAEQLRVHENDDEVLKEDKNVVIERTKIDTKGRWMMAGLATIAGGAVIGLTAGLAAPLIAGGIGAVLSTVGGVGAAGIAGLNLGGAATIAVVTTGGVLTGGGFSGKSYLKRSRGISIFEFLTIDEAMNRIEEHKLERENKRRARLKLQLREKKIKAANEARERRRNSELNEKKKNLLTEDPNHIFPIDTDLDLDTLTGSPSLSFNSPMVEVTDSGGNEEDTDESEVITSPISPVHEKQEKQTNALITISGWITYGEDDFTLPFSTLQNSTYGDHYSLIWETKDVQALGSALNILGNEIASFLFQQGLAATVLPVLMAGLAGPMWALKLTYLLDNPWGIGLSKASKAGKVLADTLSAQSQENRPVTLIGFSLGARIIYCCLQELAKQGKYGIIEDVYIFGCPVIASTKEWQEVSSVVAGKITNGYLERDWVLGVLYRASAASWSSVAGLSPIENVDGIVNIKLDGVIDGHLEYRLGMPKVLQHCGFKITKDYFDDDDDREEILKEELRVIKQKKEEEELRKKLEKKKREEENKEFGLKKGWFGKNDEITPKEIKSTLPALLTLKEIKSTLPTLLLSVEDRNDDEAGKSFTPKELKSTLPTLKVVSTSTTNNVTSENLEKNSHSSHSYIDVSSPNNFGSNTHVDSVIEDKFVGLTGEELEKELVKHASTQKDVYFYKSGAGDKADLDNDELEDLHNPLDLSGLALEDGGGLVWDQNQWE